MQRRGVELAINTIILITLGLFLLVVCLFLIKKYLIDVPLPELEPPFGASQNNPLVADHTSVRGGKSVEFIIDFYNTEESGITIDELPSITCPGVPGISLEAAGLSIGVHEGNRYLTILSATADIVPKAYPCTVSLSETQAQVVITVTS